MERQLVLPLPEIKTSRREGAVVPRVLAVLGRDMESPGKATDMHKLRAMTDRYGVDFAVYNGYHANLGLDRLINPADVDAALYLGSSNITFSKGEIRADNYLDKTQRFTTQFAESTKPMLGVCLGDQALAIHLGGDVDHAGNSRESDVVEHVLFDGTKVNMIGVHNDVVTRLPRSAEVIGTTDKDPYSIWMIGDTIHGYQNHLELGQQDVQYVMDVIDQQHRFGQPDAYARFANPDRPVSEGYNDHILHSFFNQARGVNTSSGTSPNEF